MSKIFKYVANYESDDFLYDTISQLEYCDVHTTFKQLISHGAKPTDLFNAVFEYYSLQKIGHLDDKVFEMFGELSAYCYSTNMEKHKEITLYRGASDDDSIHNGVSWTTDERVAKWFAARFNRPNITPVVATITIKTNDCLGSSPIHNLEREVIVHPDNLPSDINYYKMTDTIRKCLKDYINGKEGK